MRVPPSLRALRGVALAATLLAPLASAQTLYVRSNAAPGGSGLSWAGALADLSDALQRAGTTPGITAVWVAAGRYEPTPTLDREATFRVPSGITLAGGFAGTEASLDERDLTAHVTLLDGDLKQDDLPGLVGYADNSRHVVRAEGVSFVALDGLTIRGGSEGGGAGLRILASSAHLANLVVVENWGLGNNNAGGGAFVVADDLTVDDCRFLDNKATAGAGIFLDYPDFGTATFERCTFERNHATGGAGISASGSLAFFQIVTRGCTFRDNLATGGAGIQVSTEQPMGLVVDACLFEGNEAGSGAGISVSSEQSSQVEVFASTFRRGLATTGGGLYVHSESSTAVDVTECLFEDNGVCAGGGIYVYGAAVVAQRCRFLAGTRTGCGLGTGGDGIRLELAGDLADVRDSLLVGGELGLVWSRGDGITLSGCTLVNLDRAIPVLRVQAGHAEIADSILWGLATQQVTLGAGASVSAHHSDVHMGGGGLPGTGNIDLDPLFVSAATGDYALQASSPCIDAGDPATQRVGSDVERDSRLLDGDLDGTLRIDMGADEFGPVRLRVLGPRSVGSTLTFLTTGTAGLNGRMLFGAPGLRFLPGVGTLFSAAAGLQSFPWPSTPSSVPAVVPPSALGLSFVVQELCLVPGGARTLTNFVRLDF